jgi:hypothetical protein
MGLGVTWAYGLPSAAEEQDGECGTRQGVRWRYTIAGFMEVFSVGRAAVCPPTARIFSARPRAGNRAHNGRAARACRQLLPR